MKKLNDPIKGSTDDQIFFKLIRRINPFKKETILQEPTVITRTNKVAKKP